MNSPGGFRGRFATGRLLVVIVQLSFAVLLPGTFTSYHCQQKEPTAALVPASTCARPKGQPPIDFENEHYSVKHSRVVSPFNFLPWVKALEVEAAKAVAPLVEGKAFTYKVVRDDAVDLIGPYFTPESDEGRIKFRISVVRLENCTADKNVDVVYQIYSSRVLPVLNAAPEARITERQTPQVTAGMTGDNIPGIHPLKFMPMAAFDQTDDLAVGGRLEFKPARLANAFIKSFEVDGLRSSEMHSASFEASGSADYPEESKTLLAHSEWRFSFANSSLPTGSGALKGGQLSAQFSAITKPFMSGNMTARFGGLIEGGNRQSDVRDVPLASDTTANAGFGSISLYAGVTSRLSHNVLSLSYGLKLGATDDKTKLDWVKQIADMRHEFWYSLGDHRPLSLESRFTVGTTHVKNKIPLAEKFFGGNQEKFFMPGDQWQIRENPMIRSIPGEQYFRTSEGSGSNRFISYNLTVAYAVWREPLVPGELSNDEEVRSQIDEGINSSANITQIKLETDDDNYKHLINVYLPLLPDALENLKQAVIQERQLHPTPPTPLEEKFQECLENIDDAIDRTSSAISTTEVAGRYGFVITLLRISDANHLSKVVVSVTELNQALGGIAALTDKTQTLDGIRNNMEADFAKINRAQAEKSAHDSLAFARRTVNTLLDDVNLFSVSPVFVFDVARIGPRKEGVGGVRCGPGAGIRFELASTAYFTLGYARNVGRGPGESSGAVFFSIGMRDLFR